MIKNCSDIALMVLDVENVMTFFKEVLKQDVKELNKGTNKVKSGGDNF